MLGKMRVISSLSLSVVMLLLLTLKVLPHHHHTLHLSGSDTVVETLHFGVEECEDGCDSSHDHCEKCPSEHTYCLLKACEELNYYKYTQECDFSPAILSFVAVACLPSGDTVHAPPHINLKIPDSGAQVLSLRAPPHTVC